MTDETGGGIVTPESPVLAVGLRRCGHGRVARPGRAACRRSRAALAGQHDGAILDQATVVDLVHLLHEVGRVSADSGPGLGMASKELRVRVYATQEPGG